MSRIKKQLVDIGYQIDNLRNDLSQTLEQYAVMEEMAEEANIRAIVSETLGQDSQAHELNVAKEKLKKSIDQMNIEIDLLKAKRDDLLDQLSGEISDNDSADKIDDN